MAKGDGKRPERDGSLGSRERTERERPKSYWDIDDNEEDDGPVKKGKSRAIEDGRKEGKDRTREERREIQEEGRGRERRKERSDEDREDRGGRGNGRRDRSR